MKEVTVFAPATVANVSCGFDVLGFAIDGIGDTMTLKKGTTKGITITSIEGADVPLETEKNVAGVAGLALLEHIKADFGFEISIKKGIPLGSGIGGSAASAAAVVFGINQFLDDPLSLVELAYFAMKGEALASGNEHADNVAPSLFGGFTLIPGYDPFEVISLPVPSELYVAIIHPHIEIKTKEAREILPKQVPLKDAITQSGNLAGLISGLYTDNYELISRSVKDVLIEPHRKKLLPHFDSVKEIALNNGTLAFGISGSGPSMFALCRGEVKAEQISELLTQFYQNKGLGIDSFVSKVSSNGSRII
jgi:homoserine kinase